MTAVYVSPGTTGLPLVPVEVAATIVAAELAVMRSEFVPDRACVVDAAIAQLVRLVHPVVFPFSRLAWFAVRMLLRAWNVMTLRALAPSAVTLRVGEARGTVEIWNC